MKKKIKKLLIISGAVFSSILILLIISSLFFYFNKSLTKRILEKYIADKAGARLEIGKLDYDLFPLSVQAYSVKVFQEIRGMEIDIFLNQLSIEGEINRLLKKQKPTLSSIEISGAVFHIFQGEEEEEMEVDFQENMLLLSDLFSYAARINFKDFSFKYIAPSNSVNFERGSFFLSGSDKKGEFNYSISGEKALISNIDRKVSFESSLSSSGKFSLIDMPYFEGEILLESINFTQIEEKILLPEISLRLKSEFRLDEKMLIFPQFEMNVPPFFDASGYLKAGLGEDFSLLSLSKVHLKDLNKTHVFLKPYLMPYLPPQLKNLALEGGAYLEGEYQYIKNSSGEKYSVKSLVKLEPTRISCINPSFSFTNLISGEIKMEGSLPNINFSGSLMVKNGNFSKNDLKIKDFKTPFLSKAPLQINFLVGRNKFMIEPVTMEIFGGKAAIGKSVFSIGSKPSDIHGTLSFSMSDMDLSQLPIESDRFNLSGLANVDLSHIEIDPEELATIGKGEVDIFDTRVNVENIKIAKPFSENRTISCDVEFKDLNLEKLTDSIPFGRVTGILRGEIKDLAFS